MLAKFTNVVMRHMASMNQPIVAEWCIGKQGHFLNLDYLNW